MTLGDVQGGWVETAGVQVVLRYQNRTDSGIRLRNHSGHELVGVRMRIGTQCDIRISAAQDPAEIGAHLRVTNIASARGRTPTQDTNVMCYNDAATDSAPRRRHSATNDTEVAHMTQTSANK
jgi:hypothetical protein